MIYLRSMKDVEREGKLLPLPSSSELVSEISLSALPERHKGHGDVIAGEMTHRHEGNVKRKQENRVEKSA